MLTYADACGKMRQNARCLIQSPCPEPSKADHQPAFRGPVSFPNTSTVVNRRVDNHTKCFQKIRKRHDSSERCRPHIHRAQWGDCDVCAIGGRQKRTRRSAPMQATFFWQVGRQKWCPHSRVGPRNCQQKIRTFMMELNLTFTRVNDPGKKNTWGNSCLSHFFVSRSLEHWNVANIYKIIKVMLLFRYSSSGQLADRPNWRR